MRCNLGRCKEEAQPLITFLLVTFLSSPPSHASPHRSVSSWREERPARLDNSIYTTAEKPAAKSSRVHRDPGMIDQSDDDRCPQQLMDATSVHCLTKAHSSFFFSSGRGSMIDMDHHDASKKPRDHSNIPSSLSSFPRFFICETRSGLVFLVSGIFSRALLYISGIIPSIRLGDSTHDESSR